MASIHHVRPCAKAVENLFNLSLTMGESGLVWRAIRMQFAEQSERDGQLSFNR
jgi:hypothetical protein